MTYKHVAVIGIDGMGNFNKASDTPRMDKIFADGSVTYSALSMDPTISAENWGAMLIGANPLVHKLTNSRVSVRRYNNPALPSVFKRIRRAFPDAYLASVCNWNPINHGIIENSIGVDKKTAEDDEKLCPIVKECVKKKPVFLFVQFDDVDGAGHRYGYGTPEYCKAVSRADALTGEVYDAYEQAGLLDDTLFIVIADHGGYIRSHGGYTDGEKYVFLGVCGKGVKKGQIAFAKTKDIAATVLFALGLDIPRYNDAGFSSQIPEGIFDGSPCYMLKETREAKVNVRQTPGNIFEFFPKEKFKLALHLDNSLDDAAGKCRLQENGAVKFYSSAVNGSCAEFGATGWARVDNISFGRDSFTVSLWLQKDPSLIKPVAVLGGKSWFGGCKKGFAIALRSNDILFGINDEDEIIIPFPEEISGGWINALVSVDTQSNEFNFYMNFEKVFTFNFDGDVGVLDSDSFVIGNDTDEKYNDVDNRLIFRTDDVFIFNFAFTGEDVRTLEEYYV